MDLVQIIIQGGSVGIAVYAIYALTKIISELKTIIGNHIDHSTEVQKDLAVAIAELKEVIETLADRQVRKGDKNHYNK